MTPIFIGQMRYMYYDDVFCFGIGSFLMLCLTRFKVIYTVVLKLLNIERAIRGNVYNLLDLRKPMTQGYSFFTYLAYVLLTFVFLKHFYCQMKKTHLYTLSIEPT